MLQQAVEAEVAEAIAQFAELKDEQGRQRVVRNGYLPERIFKPVLGTYPCAHHACVTELAR